MDDDRNINIGSLDLADDEVIVMEYPRSPFGADPPVPMRVRRMTRAQLEAEERADEELRAKLAVCGRESAAFLETEGKRLGPRHVRVQAARALLRAARRAGVAPPRPKRRGRRKPAE
jgi:hypothetical protein